MTIPFSMSYLKALSADPNAVKLSEMNFIQSLERAFILAGGLEEVAKLILIIVILLILPIFHKKVKNVYEYILIGACVGIGFSIIKEYTYGADNATIVSAITRMIAVPALLVPVVVHTLYDVCTAFNSSLMRGELSGMIRALIGYAFLVAYELFVLIRCKKKTAMFCGMSTLAKDAA